MSDVHLTMSCGDYDRTRALIDGRVKPEGIELTTIPLPTPERMFRMLQNGEFDVCESSTGMFLAGLEAGRSWVGIPVFPHRRFRHAYIFVHKESGITKPKDLEGRRVGVPRLANTAALWARGALTHDYGVDQDQVHWVPFSDEYAEGMEKPKDTSLSEVVTNKSELQALKDREIDAYISPSEAAEILDPNSVVGRLFPNFIDEEKEYFRRTKLFPIMHTFVIRDSLIHEEPWIVRSMMEAWQEAIDKTYKYVRDQRKSVLVWYGDYWRQEREFFADWDPWKMDFQHNYAMLDALCQYGHEQRLVETRFKPEDIWVTGPLD